jgi:hypothetical protein
MTDKVAKLDQVNPANISKNVAIFAWRKNYGFDISDP